MLECGRGIGESKRHNTPFKGAIAGMEGGFQLITFLNLDKVVSMSEINFGEESGPARTIKEVRDTGERVTVLLHDFVEAPEVDTKPERAILFLDK